MSGSGVGSVMAPGFERMLEGWDVPALESHVGAVYGLWPDLTLAYLSPSWFRFAAENGGEAIAERWRLGRRVLDAVPGVLFDFYRRFYADRLAKAWIKTPHPPVHLYECSSATTFRRFAMHLYSLKHGAGLLVVNSLLVDVPHDPAHAPASPFAAAAYVHRDGLVHQCAHCRRVQTAAAPARWDWVPQWVEAPPVPVSHTLCRACLDSYYPGS